MADCIIPKWARTVGDLHRTLSRVRSHCEQCGVEQVVETRVLVAMYGQAASLVDRTSRCCVVGCGGPVYYSAYTTYGRPLIRLVTDPERIAQIEVSAAPPINAETLREAGLGSGAPAAA